MIKLHKILLFVGLATAVAGGSDRRRVIETTDRRFIILGSDGLEIKVVAAEPVDGYQLMRGDTVLNSYSRIGSE